MEQYPFTLLILLMLALALGSKQNWGMAIERNPEYKYQPLSGRELATQLDIGLLARATDLRRRHGVTPRLEILSNNEAHGPSLKYVGMKEKVGKRLGFIVNSNYVTTSSQLDDSIHEFNLNPEVHGIIVQLPLKDDEPFSDLVNNIAPTKDVDGLGRMPLYAPATPTAIRRILRGNGFDYVKKPTVLNGLGTLVNLPLLGEMQQEGAHHVSVIDEHTPKDERYEQLNEAFIIISAVGKEVLDVGDFSIEAFEHTKVIVDAGTAEVKKGGGEKVIHGDVTEELRLRMPDHWFASESIGGVGPLTIRSLLANVALSAESLVEQ